MTTPSQSTLQPGDVLVGKYCVERVLGKGGMGEVVAARHLHLGELFAIKVMLPEMLEQSDAVDRFLREAQASARLRGEHVARVHDVGRLESGIPYMVLEYLEGTDLDNILGTRGALEVGDAASYLYQVCEALVEAHGLGIVHRDLKPANLFLTRRANGTPCIKVLDFGISKDASKSGAVLSKLTKTGALMGSPHYMSPEQMVDSRSVDARSDIWALGVILYELVTGTVAFNADTMPEIVAKILSLQPPPPSRVRPGIPPEFDAIVARGMEKDRTNRFQTVQEFMDALRPYVNESDIRLSKPLSIPPSISRERAMAVTQAEGWGKETTPAVQSGKETPAASSSGRTWLIAAIVGVLVMVVVAAFLISRPPEGAAQGGPDSSNAASSKQPEPVVSAASETIPATSPPAQSATVAPTGNSPAVLKVPQPVVSVPPPVVSTTSKTKKKVKGFDE